jgi:hypothetical protein
MNIGNGRPRYAESIGNRAVTYAVREQDADHLHTLLVELGVAAVPHIDSGADPPAVIGGVGTFIVDPVELEAATITVMTRPSIEGRES